MASLSLYPSPPPSTLKLLVAAATNQAPSSITAACTVSCYSPKVKHPRRDGLLVFATETEEEFKQWVKAFQSGATIEVQPVSNVEEMRITDLEMQRRWTNVDKDPFNEFEVRRYELFNKDTACKVYLQ